MLFPDGYLATYEKTLLTAFQDVLVSQQALYASQNQLVQSETTALTNLIALYKALGGGWEGAEFR